jgi:hypothetical protein
MYILKFVYIKMNKIYYFTSDGMKIRYAVYLKSITDQLLFYNFNLY